VKNICAHLNAFHAYTREPSRSVQTNHYCGHVSKYAHAFTETLNFIEETFAYIAVDEDVRQCLLYDSTEKNAKLIGIEYMITPKLYESLPADERRLWHSHVYEVKSGMLIMPNNVVPAPAWELAEKKEMEQVITLYGKAYHLWQTDRGDVLPLGEPQLMTSYTADGQFDFNGQVGKRDKEFGVDSGKKKEGRADIPEPTIHAGTT
jgi:hypothetical protein